MEYMPGRERAPEAVPEGTQPDDIRLAGTARPTNASTAVFSKHTHSTDNSGTRGFSHSAQVSITHSSTHPSTHPSECAICEVDLRIKLRQGLVSSSGIPNM